MTRWVTSDLHLGHRLVAGIRGFTGGDGTPDTAAHDTAVTANWGKVVAADDIVYVLGDITLRSPALIWDIIDGLPGRKIVIAGNHDAVHPMHRDAWKHQAEWLNHFEAVLPFLRVKVAGQDVLLSHFPYTGDRGTDRYPQYRLRDERIPLIHGHTHGKETVTRTSLGTVQVHAGLDARNLTPVSLDTIIATELTEGTRE